MIEISDVTKRYGSTVAVDHLTFKVRPGEVTGFLGPNGAGKSTTMGMVVGLDAPTSGQVTATATPTGDSATGQPPRWPVRVDTRCWGGRRHPHGAEVTRPAKDLMLGPSS